MLVPTEKFRRTVVGNLLGIGVERLCLKEAEENKGKHPSSFAVPQRSMIIFRGSGFSMCERIVQPAFEHAASVTSV